MGGTRHEPAPHEPLREAIKKMWLKPRMVGIPAVEAEPTGQDKDHRSISQQKIAELFGVDPRCLRTWADKYREVGIEGLRARGGQGRKPGLSGEEVEAGIKKAREGGGRIPELSRGRGRQGGACRK